MNLEAALKKWEEQMAKQGGALFGFNGVSALEYHAGLAMKGLLSSGRLGSDPKEIAKKAWDQAEAMVAEGKSRKSEER